MDNSVAPERREEYSCFASSRTVWVHGGAEGVLLTVGRESVGRFMHRSFPRKTKMLRSTSSSLQLAGKDDKVTGMADEDELEHQYRHPQRKEHALIQPK